MSTPFYDLASLVVVPSGYKSGKIYAQKPLTTDGQLTFTRASTATRVNASGLIESVASGVPRLDYLGSSCPKILLEPSRTNTAFPSENFSGYTSASSSISTNQAVAPDGATTADLMYPAANNSFVGRYKSFSAGTTGVVSCFVKQAGKRYAIIGTDNTAPFTCIFDLQTATVVYAATNYTGKIESYGNGWYRISATYTSSAGNVYPFIGVADGSNGAVTANGTNGLYIWGFQYEVNVTYATSYIPTTSAAVTRLADAASKTGISSLIGQTEGTLFVDIDFKAHDAQTYIALENWASLKLIRILSDTNTQIAAQVFDSGVTTFASNYYSASVGSRYKCALAYKNNDFAFYINGVQISTSTSGAVPATTNFKFGDFAGGQTMNGGINQSLVFKTRLTNAQLAELTTL